MPDSDLGVGSIEPEDMEYVVRTMRHFLINVADAQGKLVELMRKALEDQQVQRAGLAAHMEAIHTLESRTFGYANDSEGGAIGRLAAAVKGVQRQNWALITLLIVSMAGLITALLHH